MPRSLVFAACTLVAGAPAQSQPEPAEQPEQPWVSRNDVALRLREAQRPRAGLLDRGPVSVFDRAWRDLNDSLDESLGLRLGLAYTLNFQAASSGPGDRSGAEGDLDLFAAWRFIGAGDEQDAGSFNLNLQHIHRIGEVAPANLSSEIGALWETSDGAGVNQSLEAVQAYYEQYLFQDRALLVVGKIDPTNYISTNRYADDTLYFMNRAFSSNPAINYPGAGLGALLAGQITDRFYLGALIADANGVETRSGFDSIGEGEFFTAVEAGYTPEFAGLGPGACRITLWRSDSATDVDLPEDFGAALSLDQEVGAGVVPFLKLAWADGDATGVSTLVAGGVAFEGPFAREDDVLGLGLSWGEAADSALPDQTVAEAFYRLQLAPSIQWTIGAQAIFNAVDANSGDEEVVGVFEMRLRVAF